MVFRTLCSSSVVPSGMRLNTGLTMPQSASIISGIQGMDLYETRAVSLPSSLCCSSLCRHYSKATISLFVCQTCRFQTVNLKHNVSIILKFFSRLSWYLLAFISMYHRDKVLIERAVLRIKLIDHVCSCSKMFCIHTGPLLFSLEMGRSSLLQTDWGQELPKTTSSSSK